VPKYPKRDPSGWEPLAHWYDGWVGEDGSDHHRNLAIPAALDLLQLRPGDTLLDVGAGQGVFAPYAARAGAVYTGVEVSRALLKLANKRHRSHGRFLHGDARHLPQVVSTRFDAALFLLSIQDMNPLDAVLRSAASVLQKGGRIVLLMTHPCFRIPRQSGWGHDTDRDLRFRRIDRYLQPLKVPMKSYGERQSGVSISFHRPLSHYINGLAACGLMVDALEEITTHKQGSSRAEQRANAEIPLFVGIRARKLGQEP
jgi:ubiquinone/menaquinone biosynthesis C-methylase UbiE